MEEFQRKMAATYFFMTTFDIFGITHRLSKKDPTAFLHFVLNSPSLKNQQ